MIENFLQYGQWVILFLSILSLYLVSSVKHETRLNGYILTGVSRFSGAAVFIFVDLFAFVIANLIQTYIAFRGYYKNKKAIIGYSIVDGAYYDDDIIWKALGSSAAKSDTKPYSRPGWKVGLRNFQSFDSPITLEKLRLKSEQILKVRKEIDNQGF